MAATQKCDAFVPSVVSNLCITTGARPVIHVHHGRMHTLVRAAIRCLHACIFRLESVHMLIIIMLASHYINRSIEFTCLNLIIIALRGRTHCLMIHIHCGCSQIGPCLCCSDVSSCAVLCRILFWVYWKAERILIRRRNLNQRPFTRPIATGRAAAKSSTRRSNSCT